MSEGRATAAHCDNTAGTGCLLHLMNGSPVSARLLRRGPLTTAGPISGSIHEHGDNGTRGSGSRHREKWGKEKEGEEADRMEQEAK